MGVEYRLFKEKPFKQSFDLDKGCWRNLLKFPEHMEKILLPCFFKDRADLSNKLQDEVYLGGIGDCCHEGDYSCPKCKTYFDELADRLISWCGEEEIFILSDNDDEFYDLKKDYPITEDRFVPRLFKPLSG